MNRARQPVFNITVAIQFAVMVLTVGTTYGILSTRVSTLESTLVQIQTKFEREVVPRSEHLQMNAVLEQRLTSIIETQTENRRQMEQIQLKIDQVLLKR